MTIDPEQFVIQLLLQSEQSEHHVLFSMFRKYETLLSTASMSCLHHVWLPTDKIEFKMYGCKYKLKSKNNSDRF